MQSSIASIQEAITRGVSEADEEHSPSIVSPPGSIGNLLKKRKNNA